MSSQPAFTAAAPLTLMPRTFIEGLEQKFSDYVQAIDNFDDSYLKTNQLYTALKGTPPGPKVEQRRLSCLCSQLLIAGRERGLFLTYCLKNIAFVTRITRRSNTRNLFNERIYAKTGLDAPDFRTSHLLRDEIVGLYAEIYDGVSMAYGIMSEATQEFRRTKHATHGDPFLESLNQTGRIYRQDYYDWLEYHFLRKFDLRLGQFPVMKDMRDSILKKVTSPHFRSRLVRRIANGTLQGSFPGLSIDGAPASPSQLKLARQRIAPYAAFTPGEKTHVIQITSPAA